MTNCSIHWYQSQPSSVRQGKLNKQFSELSRPEDQSLRHLKSQRLTIHFMQQTNLFEYMFFVGYRTSCQLVICYCRHINDWELQTNLVTRGVTTGFSTIFKLGMEKNWVSPSLECVFLTSVCVFISFPSNLSAGPRGQIN